jgi:poly-gamma-glutamate capsule biosynthesis protein CapA/YwtB (metallophosphatase superfamily)
VGDIQMGRAWPKDRIRLAPDGARDLFAGVKAVLADADLTLGNLETVLADEGESHKCKKLSNRCFAFRVPTAYAAVLRDAGFDALSIANNHAGDFGPQGRRTTMAALDGVGIRHSGPVGDLASLEAKGRRVAMAGFSFGDGVYRIQEIEAGRKLVRDLAARHDQVVVFFHGGAEGRGAEHVRPGVERFLGEDRGDSRAFARAMVDAGADLILGAGPHTLRAMEIYRGRLIAYSLGNFSSWDTFDLSGGGGISCVLKLALAPNGVVIEADVAPVLLEPPGRPVPDPKRRAIERIRTLSHEDFGIELFDANGRYRRAATSAVRGPD